jgi:uncharacterized Zn finger protein (UPF0148 family)
MSENSYDDAAEYAAALRDDECPVCHGALAEKDGVPWCPNCDLKFSP